MSRFTDFWKEKFAGKNENSPAFRRRMAQKINSSRLKYVTERKNDEETVLCRTSYISVSGDELMINSESGTVFRAQIDSLAMNELLSMEGIILTGADLEHGGEERCIVAYYTYYRKVD